MYPRFAVLFVLLLAVAGAVYGDGGSPSQRLAALYRKADSLFHLAQSTPATDSMALADFSAVIAGLQAGPADGVTDSLLAGALLRKGVLLDAAGDYSGARAAYCGALLRHRAEDSLVFVAEIYAGATYYNLNRFDSANYFLLHALTKTGRFNDRDDEVRLYNTLGVLYYDNGNYRQGKDYFDRALEMVRGRRPLDTAAAVSLQTNIATSFFRLEQYQQALSIYRQLLAYRPLTSYVNMNMGRAYAGLNEYQAALACFRKVDAGKLPGVWNELAHAQERLHRPDSCAWYLHRLQDAARRSPLRFNVLDLGINALYEAAWHRDLGRLPEALASLQRAIVIFSRNFTDTNVYANPSNFTGSFAYYRLFDALAEKAALFGQLYSAKPDEAYLKGSYAAYMSALSLLRYIEKSYATDEAKLFLKQKSGPAHAGALAACLQLHRLHPSSDYLEQAFLISERSKASVITTQLEERTIMGMTGSARQLLQKVNDCKYNIARLDVRSEGTTDSGQLAALAREREGNELELSRLQQQLEQNGEYYKLKYEDASPGIRDLQGELQTGQALISLYAAGGVLHVFVVTKDDFKYIAIDSLNRLQSDVADWLQALKTTGNGRRFHGEAVGRRLYAELVRPIQSIAGNKREWILIPDGFLYLLPWESLPADPDGRQYLLETTTVSYRWSSKLLREDWQGPGRIMDVLSFAPFAKAGGGKFSRLPASADEIAGLGGAQYLDAAATKAEFLQAVNHYPIVHLATHAVSSTDDAAASFIAFYPKRAAVMEDRLFLEELYGLDLRPTRLVIISACETGEGKVIAQEGVISLARAFAYAGCGSTINSLWKADDRATSYILRQFYLHLKEGETKARALQLAKLDYLHSDAVDKSPAYWAHLVLTGDSSPLYKKRSTYWWLWLFSPVIVILGMMVRRKKKKSTV
ncbi:MAG TPA: CHAT domain-containing tetratricopeptide repeat protein [Puia sp.]|nr:CHAT domain-containing tetratricopeptide repeat protein [Puia sp.]